MTFPVAKCPTCGQRTDLATYEQKKRFFALVGLLLEKAAEKGLKYDKEWMVDMLKLKFLGGEEHELPSGKTIVSLPSLSRLEVDKMAEFQDACEAWAADKGVFLDS